MTSFLDRYLGHNERVAIDETYWVDLRPLPKGELSLCQSKLTKMRMHFDRRAGESQTEGDVDFAAFQEELVCRSVVDWNLDGPNGVLPHADLELTRRSYRQLPGAIADLLFERANALNAPPGGQEQARFPAGGSGAPEDTSALSSSSTAGGLPDGEDALGEPGVVTAGPWPA